MEVGLRSPSRASKGKVPSKHRCRAIICAYKYAHENDYGHKFMQVYIAIIYVIEDKCVSANLCSIHAVRTVVYAQHLSYPFRIHALYTYTHAYSNILLYENKTKYRLYMLHYTCLRHIIHIHLYYIHIVNKYTLYTRITIYLSSTANECDDNTVLSTGISNV